MDGIDGIVLFAGVAQLAEHNVANVVVVGSNPITRSVFLDFSVSTIGRTRTFSPNLLELVGECDCGRLTVVA